MVFILCVCVKLTIYLPIMKTIFFLLLVLPSFIFSQNNYDWDMVNSIWTYRSVGTQAVNGVYSGCDFKRIVEKSEDSVMMDASASFYYNSFYATQFSLCNNSTAYAIIEDFEFLLGFHNDVLYLKQDIFSTDTLNWIPADDTIVDFNASIGDVWSFHDFFNENLSGMEIYTDYKSGVTTVLDTGSRIINGHNLKWVNVSYSVTDRYNNIINVAYYDTIFERMGPLRNLIPSEYFYNYDSNLDGGTEFACYKDDNFIEYVLDYNVCIAALDIVENSEEEFVVFPNPSNGIITINGVNYTSKNKKVQLIITDIQGKEILNKQTSYNNLNDLQINLINKGMYYVLLLENGTLINSQKIIIN